MSTRREVPRVFGHEAVETSEGVGDDFVESYEWRMGKIVAGAMATVAEGGGWIWSVGHVREDGEEHDLVEGNPPVASLEDAARAIEAALARIIEDVYTAMIRVTS